MMAASKTAVLLLFSIGFSVFYLLGLSTLSSGAALVQPTAATNQENTNQESDNPLREMSIEDVAIPSDIIADAKCFVVETRRIDVSGVDTFLRTATPLKEASNLTFLFLHGAAFSSKVWHDLGSLQLVAALGFKAFAIDLPGFCQTSDQMSSDRDSPVEYLTALFQVLKLEQVILIVPSMSGRFGLPFLVKHPELVSGFVPVAPIATESVSQSQLQSLQVPTLSIIGENDARLGRISLNNLKVIPNFQNVVLKNAGHAAYLDEPEKFHNLLFNFAQKLQK